MIQCVHLYVRRYTNTDVLCMCMYVQYVRCRCNVYYVCIMWHFCVYAPMCVCSQFETGPLKHILPVHTHSKKQICSVVAKDQRRNTYVWRELSRFCHDMKVRRSSLAVFGYPQTVGPPDISSVPCPCP